MSNHYRIIIFTAFFEEHVGYQEVQLAKVLRRMGHEVMVVTTDRSNLDLVKRYSGISFENVLRVTNVLRIRNTFLPFKIIRKEVSAFKPDVALIIHPGAGLPYFYLSSLPDKCKVISFFGDLDVVDKVGKAAGIKGNAWIQKVIKDRWYNKTFQRSDVIVANTNETTEILQKCAKRSIEKKIVMPGLGFDPETYFPSIELRTKTRKEMGLSDDHIILLTITRVYAGKPIIQWLNPVITQLNKNPKLVYIFAGFADTEFSRQIKRELQSFHLDDRLRLLDFTSADYNNALFNAADYSLWFLPTISIQQSMATGLPAIVPFDKTLDHLVEPNHNGLYYNDFLELREVLSELNPWPIRRDELVRFNHKFSYDSIIEFLFSSIMKDAV